MGPSFSNMKVKNKVETVHGRSLPQAFPERKDVGRGCKDGCPSIALSAKEITAGSDQIAHSSSDLAKLAVKLKEVISKFKV